ncbi:hypothetical protein [Nautilia profundicola]|nr:hypothetical protein [Nautilia profundicola]
MKKLFFLCFLIIYAFSKILIVNSYDQKDQCGIPQLNGFLSLMYEQKFSPTDFDIFFLNARVTTKENLKQKAAKILKNIDKYQYVVTFDDAAFQLIAIPASKLHKTVFFSGINIPFHTYQKKYNLNKQFFGGVYEKLHIKEVLTTFNKINKINKIAILYNKGVGELVKNQIVNELKSTNFQNSLLLVECQNVKELKNKINDINNNKSITLFIPLTLSLTENNKKIPFYKLKDIYLEKIKKPDIGINMTFVKMGFLGFGGVDFFAMGKSTAKIMLNYTKTKKLHIINAPKAYYYINVNRAKHIDFKLPEWFIKNYVKELVW